MKMVPPPYPANVVVEATIDQQKSEYIVNK